MLDVNVVCEKQYQQHIDHVVGLQSCIEIVLMFIQHRSKDLNTCTTLVVSLVSNINTAFRNFGLHIYLEIMCLFKQFIYTQSQLAKCVVNCSLPIRICPQICIYINLTVFSTETLQFRTLDSINVLKSLVPIQGSHLYAA